MCRPRRSTSYELLALIAEAYGKTIAIEPDDELVIDRSLDSTRFRAATGFQPADWPELVAAHARLRLSRRHKEEIMFKDKTLLITGGTGSFGNAVLRRFLHVRRRARSASSAATRRSRTTCASATTSRKLKFYIGDVRDRAACATRCAASTTCFHAAALKQVPSCEFYPMEAVRTNVLGTENVLEAAIAARRRARRRA